MMINDKDMPRRRIVEDLFQIKKNLLESAEALMYASENIDLLTRILCREEMDSKEGEDA